MSKTAMIRSRIEPDIKEHVEMILQRLGLSVTQAISMYYNQILINNGLPFEVKVPNSMSKKVFEDTDQGKDVVVVKDEKELFKDLGL